MNEALDAVPPGAIEQHARADYVRVNEVERIVNTTINVRFGREVDDRVKLVIGHERIHLIGIGDVGFEKFVALAMFLDHAVEIGQITGIREDIDVSHVRRLVMLQNIPNKVAPDESAATGHQYAHSAR